MTYNIELFKRVYETIKVEGDDYEWRDLFNMSSWEDIPFAESCGTTRCVAGWAIYLETGERVFSKDGWLSEKTLDLAGQLGLDLGARNTRVDLVAASLLGLNKWQSNILFLTAEWYALKIVKAFAEDRVPDAESLLTDLYQKRNGVWPTEDDE